MSSLQYWIWLSELYGIGAVTAMRLLNHFGTPEEVHKAADRDYRAIEGIKGKDLSVLSNKDLSNANKILNDCTRIGCGVLTIHDFEYPERLRNIYDPPIVLYVKGKMGNLDEEPVVAIVGSRTCTQYGLKAADNIGYHLARSGFTVVTGLAKGIDTAAAKGTLRGNGRVIGVIGSGLDVLYPPENSEIFPKVEHTGALVSEYPPGAQPLAYHFPARNRILSGLSLGVAVIEAPKKSGALITASRALEQGRDVFSLPGNVDAKSNEGSNALLREGAIPFMSAEDIIGEYYELFRTKINNTGGKKPSTFGLESGETGDEFACDDEETHQINKIETNGDLNLGKSIEQAKVKIKGIDNLPEVEYIDLVGILNMLTGPQKTVAETIGLGRMHVDDIITKSGLSAQQVLTTLTMLEINGIAKCEIGKIFRLIDYLE